MEHHARWTVAQEHPEGRPQRPVAPAVAVGLLRLAEDRGVEPHRSAFEEDLPLASPTSMARTSPVATIAAAPSRSRGCRACARRSSRCRAAGCRARSLSRAARRRRCRRCRRRRRQRRARSPGYRITGGGDRLIFRLCDDQILTQLREVRFQGGPHFILGRGVGRDTGFRARCRVDQHAYPRSGSTGSGLVSTCGHEPSALGSWVLSAPAAMRRVDGASGATCLGEPAERTLAPAGAPAIHVRPANGTPSRERALPRLAMGG